MSEHDDDEHRDAYRRAKDDHISTYIDFANIIQHYDETARPKHDDIDYENNDFDSAEYDNNGEVVTLYGILMDFFKAYDDATDVDYFNDDYEDEYEDGDFYEDQPEITIYRYYFDSRPKNPCKRIRNIFKYGTYFRYPPI